MACSCDLFVTGPDTGPAYARSAEHRHDKRGRVLRTPAAAHIVYRFTPPLARTQVERKAATSVLSLPMKLLTDLPQDSKQAPLFFPAPNAALNGMAQYSPTGGNT